MAMAMAMERRRREVSSGERFGIGSAAAEWVS